MIAVSGRQAGPAAAIRLRAWSWHRLLRGANLPYLLPPVLALLFTASWLDEAARTILVLAVVVLLGVPHGALDGEIARPLLRPRFGALWFLVFALPYLGLAAAVLTAWRAAPMATLAGFLAASVWHFGVEDAGDKPLAAAARGGLAVALPVLLHPAATARFFSAVTLSSMRHCPPWLVASAEGWCVVALCWTVQAMVQGDWRGLGEAALVAGVFTAMPPLPAFAAYFVCLHAPCHMRMLVRSGLAPRVRTMRDAVWRSLPVTTLTLLIGVLLWRWFPGDTSDRLLALTLQGLAALTLPHMLLGGFASWRASHPLSSGNTYGGGRRSATARPAG